MKRLIRWFLVAPVGVLAPAWGQEDLGALEKLASAEPKPFVVVEASGKKTKSRAQGVVISPDGLVLSVGHVAWIEKDKSFTEAFRVSFRGNGKGVPGGVAHVHTTSFTDREEEPFQEHYYRAELLKQGKTRFVAGADLAVYQIECEGGCPTLGFFSQEKPEVKAGETLHLCHYTFPHKAADPFFLISPLEVVGVAKTSSGMQYLAKGYYRVGSSGGAILKDGKLIGIQSSAYTVNAADLGEVPLGLVSFELVWGEKFEGVLGQKK